MVTLFIRSSPIKANYTEHLVFYTFKSTATSDTMDEKVILWFFLNIWRMKRYFKIYKHFCGILSITGRVFQFPLPFYAVKCLPLFKIQWSSPIRKQSWNFSQLWKFLNNFDYLLLNLSKSLGEKHETILNFGLSMISWLVIITVNRAPLKQGTSLSSKRRQVNIER